PPGKRGITRPAQTQCGRLGNAPAASAASAEDESLDCHTGPQAPLPNAMMRATPAPPAEGGQARPAPLLFRARDSYRMAETRRFGVRGAAAPIARSGLPDAPAYSDFRGISDPTTGHSPSPSLPPAPSTASHGDPFRCRLCVGVSTEWL